MTNEIKGQNPIRKMNNLKGNKVIVIGCPGAGKSMFARKLRDKTGLPLFYLDMLFHNPDRSTLSREAFDAGLHEILERAEWIIDGNYRRTLPLRFEACTDVFLFDLPVEQCLQNAAARVGTVREDLPWVETEFDPDFRQYILDFPTNQLPMICDLIDRYRDTRNITIFHSVQEADEWLAGL